MLEHFFKKYEFEFALKVVKVARIIVDHILFRISILPYVFRFLFFYFLTTNFEPETYKNIRYGEKDRNYLDIYSSPIKNSPVVLYCHGGGWDSGNKVYYCLLGRTLRKKNITTVNMNYTLYPTGTVEEMVLDVKKAVEWVKNNIHNYGGDPSKIYLLGHSAGAHLLAQYLCIHSLSTHEERDSFTDYKNYFSKWNASDLDPSQIAGFIGLSGVYDMDNHLVYEKKRGVEWISRMTQTMNGIEMFKIHSPLRQISKIKSAKLPKVYLRHGEYDGTVPYESSTLFFNELKKHSASELFDVKVYPQMNHTDPIFNLMDDTYQHHSILLEDILQIVQGPQQ